MTLDSIIPSAGASAPAATNARVPKQVLDQDDFLKLLVAQFTAQDPTNPQGDLSSIAQMAQFTSLEQTKAMQADIAALHSSQRIVTANSLIGREVTLLNPAGLPVSGTVSGALMSGGSPHIIVNETPYAVEDILSFAPVNEKN
ncbi:MAG: flagellar basal-body rod modification protein FlgD [Limisphaerales bacterium]|jgi:flagellar basal-body rod modification protein FlgD